MNTEIVGQKNAINRKSIEKNSSSSSSSSSNIIIAITTTATATNTTASTSSISSSSSSSGSTNTNINIKSPKESIARKTLDNENNNDDTKIPTQIVTTTTTTTTTLTTAVVAETQKITSSPQNNEITDNLLIDTTINEQQQQQKPELKTPKTDQLMTSSTSPPTPSTTNQSDNNVKNDDDKMDIVQPVDVSATQTTATSTLYLTAQSQNISGSSSSSMSALEINEPLRLSDENEPTVPNANVHFDQIAGPSASSQARLKGNPLKRKRADSVEDFAGFDEPETQNSEKRFKDTARKSLDESQKQKNKKRQSKRKKWKSILPKPEIPINIINEKKAEIKNQSQEVINDNKSSEETNGNNNLPAMDTTENDTTLVTTPASSSIATPSTATSKTSIKATPTNTEQSRALPIHIIDKPVDPLLLVPFEMGWKREFVYRGNLNVDDKRGKADIGEVYYITPKGRKLRTKAEVTSNLRGGLVIENFTFVREPLGAPSGEIVRYAKLKRTNVKHEHNFLDIGEPDPSFGFGKRIPKPKMPKGVSPPPPSTPQSLLFSSSASSSSSASTTVNALPSTTTTPNTPLTTRTQHPLYRESSFNRRITPSVRRKSIETITEQKAKAALAMKSAKINKQQGTCTIQCVLAMGTIPQVRCIKCLCLYHNECIEASKFDRPITDYTCKNCLLESIPQPTQPPQPQPPPPPLLQPLPPPALLPISKPETAPIQPTQATIKNQLPPPNTVISIDLAKSTQCNRPQTRTERKISFLNKIEFTKFQDHTIKNTDTPQEPLKAKKIDDRRRASEYPRTIPRTNTSPNSYLQKIQMAPLEPFQFRAQLLQANPIPPLIEKPPQTETLNIQNINNSSSIGSPIGSKPVQSNQIQIKSPVRTIQLMKLTPSSPKLSIPIATSIRTSPIIQQNLSIISQKQMQPSSTPEKEHTFTVPFTVRSPKTIHQQSIITLPSQDVSFNQSNNIVQSQQQQQQQQQTQNVFIQSKPQIQSTLLSDQQQQQQQPQTQPQPNTQTIILQSSPQQRLNIIGGQQPPQQFTLPTSSPIIFPASSLSPKISQSTQTPTITQTTPTTNISILGNRLNAQNSVISGMTTWIPSTTQNIVTNRIQVDTSKVPPPQTISIIGGRKFIMVPKYNILSVSPDYKKLILAPGISINGNTNNNNNNNSNINSSGTSNAGSDVVATSSNSAGINNTIEKPIEKMMFINNKTSVIQRPQTATANLGTITPTPTPTSSSNVMPNVNESLASPQLLKLSGTQPTTPVVITATAGPLTGDVTSPVKRRAAPRIQNSSSTLSRSGGGINTVNNIVANNNNNNFNEDGHGFANGNGQKIQSVIVSPPKGKFKRGTTTTIITTPQSSSYQVVQSNRPESIKNQPSVHTLFAANFFNNVSMGYDILQNVFQYLKVQEIARASRVCRMWNHTANSNSLWRTVRMKNSQVNNWMGFTNKLIRNGTKHLDLRKMIGDGELWSDFSVNIARVQNLESIDLCRCPAQIVEELFKTNPMLRILNACAIKDKELDLNNLRNLHQLTELRIKCTGNLLEIETLAPLMELSELKHLSLTSIKELGLKGIGVLGNLTKLESLELGECVEFTNNFATHVLIKLQRLEKLRLERGQDQCSTFDILDVIPKLSNLVQLELVNFDIKSGFDIRLEKCTNIKRLLLIPTYISQSATTNHMVLSGVLKLSKQLHAFTWVVTLELLRVTELYVDQYDEKRDDVRGGGGGSGPGSNSTSTTAGGGGTPRIKQQPRDSIPILKPVPGLIDDHQRVHERNSDVPQVDILTLEDVEKILLNANSKLNFKMIKVSFSQTWRQNMIGSQLAT